MAGEAGYPGGEGAGIHDSQVEPCSSGAPIAAAITGSTICENL